MIGAVMGGYYSAGVAIGGQLAPKAGAEVKDTIEKLNGQLTKEVASDAQNRHRCRAAASLRRHKAFEHQAAAHGIDAGEAKHITDGRVGGRTAAHATLGISGIIARIARVSFG
jgi:hypothetical protein